MMMMDLDLNCSPPSPLPSSPVIDDVREDLRQAMLRQELVFRDQVIDLHRLYWTQKNLMDEIFWSQPNLHTRHSSHESLMMDLVEVDNRDASSDSDALGKSREWESDMDAGTNEFNVNVGGIFGTSSTWAKADVDVREGSSYRNAIDLEKPAVMENMDAAEMVSSSIFAARTHRNGGFWNGSECIFLEDRSHAEFVESLKQSNSHLARAGSIGSSDTLERLPADKLKTSSNKQLQIDLNIAQCDDSHGSAEPDSVQVLTPSVSSSIVHPGNLWRGFGNTSQKGYESGNGSTKGSSITVQLNLPSVSALVSSQEITATNLFQDHKNTLPSRLEVKLCGSTTMLEKSSSGCYGGSNSSLGSHKPLEEAVPLHVGLPNPILHNECRRQNLADDREEINFNASVGSTNLSSRIGSDLGDKQAPNDGSEEDTVSSHAVAKMSEKDNCSSTDKIRGKDLLLPISVDTEIDQLISPDSGIQNNQSVLIPETPEGHDYPSLKLRMSEVSVLNGPDSVKRLHVEARVTDSMVTLAAETLLSISVESSACFADSLGRNTQTAAEEESDEPRHSLDSFEETILNLEEIRDDGLSGFSGPAAVEGPYEPCGIKLRRGRGMRDFQREILPGLVSLARHEICDDLHAIGFQLRKTRTRRTNGGPPRPRGRPPRRCSASQRG